MAAYWVVALLAAFVSNASGARIVGGEHTTIDQYPSIVQVNFLSTWSGTWSQSCAANILNSYYVVSAAHCFDGWGYDPSNRQIRAGATDRNFGGIVINVLWSLNHPSYGNSNYDGDISVIRLVAPLEFNPVIQPGTIVAQGFKIPDNLPVIHAGWGTTTAGGWASTVLQDVTIYTVNNELCRTRYAAWSSSAVVTENMICAGILDVGGKDACQGDSGGPLYYDSQGNNMLVGIVSWGRSCAMAEYPGVSTNVGSYTQWIVENAV